MTKLERWTSLALALALVPVPSLADERSGGDDAVRPSVLLVTLDTVRADRIGCYGATGAATPHLDALAASGVRFENALSPSPLTLPSHASMMTGRVPRRHGVLDNARSRLDGSMPVLAERLRQAGYRTLAFVSAAVLDRRLGLDRGFDVYDDEVRVGDRQAFNYQERAASQTTAAVLDRAEELAPPFFLWVHYYDPHLPYVPPEPFRERFAGRPYDGEIAFVDRELEPVLDLAGRKAGGSLITLVVGDHGESLGEHGEASHGVFLYQATQHVPWIVAGRGISVGTVVRDNVGLVDLAPTVLDLLDLPPLPETDGRSLAPALEGGKIEAADYEMEALYPYFAYAWSPLRALVRGRLKYIEAPRPELYDIVDDRRELHDLARERAKQVRRLAGSLGELTEGAAIHGGRSPDAELAEVRRRIESLGYVGGAGTGDPETATVDPKDGIRWIADLDAGREALQLGDPAAGIAPLERLLGRNPANVPALLTLGQCRLATGDLPGAEQAFRRAVELHPDDAVTRFNLANVLSGKSRTDPAAVPAARAEFERVLELNPRYAEAYLNYSLLLLARGLGPEAEAVLRRARKAGVRDPDIETEIGMLARVRGDLDATRAAFESALTLNPREPVALDGLARLGVARGDLEAAAGYWARALDAAPSVEIAVRLAKVLGELDRPSEALEALKTAHDLTPAGHPERAVLADWIRVVEDSLQTAGPTP